jgi:putative endonuclease
LPRPSSQLRWGRRLKDKSPGAWGEDLALRYLIQNRYELVERNYRTRRGEIDLIVRKDEALVFVEVKLRRGTGYGDPLEAVTPRKQSTLRSVAEHYLYARRPHYDTLRFDVIGILADRPDVRIHHVEDAF